jgi:Outer membrane protein beta-barrel domain
MSQSILARHRVGAALLFLGVLNSGDPGVARGQGSTSTIPPHVTLRAGLSVSEHYGTKSRDQEYRVKSHRRASGVASVSLFLPVTDRFGLQQEICYVRKGSRQDIGVEILELPTVLHVVYDIDYIEIPAMLRFTWKTSKSPTIYSLSGFALSLRMHDRYVLEGEVSDGIETIPLRANADMREVSGFDYGFVYGFGSDFELARKHLGVEYRFTIGWNELRFPTYAYVPFGEEEILIQNEPVPLRNQCHWITLGYRF